MSSSAVPFSIEIKFQPEVTEEDESNGPGENCVGVIFSASEGLVLVSLTLHHPITHRGHGLHVGVDLAVTLQGGVFVNVPLFDIFVIATVKVFVHSIVAVWMVITHQFGVDADLNVVSCAGEVFWVGAGQAAIAGVTAGIAAVVRIPVFSLVVFSDECLEVLAVFIVIKVFVHFSGANGLIVNSNQLFFSAGLIDGEDSVREILASAGEDLLVVLNMKRGSAGSFYITPFIYWSR